MQLYGLLLFSSLSGAAPAGGSEASGGTPIAQVFYLSALACAIAATRPLATPKRLLVIPATLVAALCWCWLSVTWAILPSTSLRRVVLVTVIVWTVLLLVRRLGYDRTLVALRWTLGGALLVCYLAVFAVPSVGVQPPGGGLGSDATPGWRGIMIEKNASGAFAAMTLLVFLFDRRSMRPWVKWPMVAAAFVYLVGTQSKTSLGLMVLVIPAAFLLGRFNPAHRLLLAPAALVLGVLVLLFWDRLAAPFHAALYDPSLFTGRGLIWLPVTKFVAEHPWRGSGFGSFWAIGDLSPVLHYTQESWVHTVSEGHDGYLDLTAATGFPGLVLGVTAVFIVPLVKAMASRHAETGQSTLVIAMILFCAGNNVTETTLLSRETFLNVMAMFAIGLLGEAMRPKRAALPAPAAAGGGAPRPAGRTAAIERARRRLGVGTPRGQVNGS